MFLSSCVNMVVVTGAGFNYFMSFSVLFFSNFRETVVGHFLHISCPKISRMPRSENLPLFRIILPESGII